MNSLIQYLFIFSNLFLELADAEDDIELKIPRSIKKVPSKTEREMELLIESSLEKVFK